MDEQISFAEKFWGKVTYVLGLLPIGAIFGLAAYLATIEVKDLDLWLHLAMGKFISINKYVPQVDILSCCNYAGTAWDNHEWLFQVLVYNIFNTWGANGLLNMQATVVVLTMVVLLLLGYNRNNQLGFAFLFFMLYLLYQQRFTIRPDIFSLLFFALYIYILALHIDKKWAVWALVCVQVLWTNFHGFFFFGPLFILIGLVSEVIKRRVPLPWEWNDSGGLTDEEFKRLGFIFVGVILACLVNPSFVKGAWYPIKVFFTLSGENKIFFSYIQELQKPVLMHNIFQENRYIYYKLFVFISFVSFVLNRRKIDISALLFWIVFLVFSLKAARNLAFFGFAAYLVTITNLISIDFKQIVPLRFTGKEFQHITTALIKLLFLWWIFTFSQGLASKQYYDFQKYEYKSAFGGVTLEGLPRQAVDFLVENNVEGNFFNDFNSGAYLIGRAFPKIKVFIDGRTEAYGGTFFKKFQKMWDGTDTELLEEYIDKYNVTGAFLNSSRLLIPKKILSYFYDHDDWKVVYFNYDAVIFLKDVPKNKELIDRHEIDLTKWKVTELDLYRLGASRVVPFHSYYRAYSLQQIGLADAAIAEAKMAIEVAPGYSEPYHLLGKIYAEKEDYQQAFENFRKAAVITPYNKELRYNLALSYVDLGEYKESAKQYRRIVEIWPHEVKATFSLAKVYIKDHQYDLGLKTLKKALLVLPNNSADCLNIGDEAFEQKEYARAIEIYKLALGIENKLSETNTRLAKSYQALGDINEAKKYLEAALKLDPENSDLKKLLDELNS